MILARLVVFVVGLTGAVLGLGGLAVAGYQQWYGWRHGSVPHLPFVYIWQWARIDPALLIRLVGHRTGARLLQLPLWVGLLVPGVVIGSVGSIGARWIREWDARRRDE